MKQIYNVVVTYLVGANIDFIWAQGPYKKHVALILMTFPKVYIVANGVGLPTNNWPKRNNDPIDIINPSIIQIINPDRRCSYDIVGQNAQTSSSKSSYHSFYFSTTNIAFACFKNSDIIF